MHACNKKDIYIPDHDHPIPPFIDRIEANASRNHTAASGGNNKRKLRKSLNIARVNWKHIMKLLCKWWSADHLILLLLRD